jgi:uncharacterized coiled-coil DUF342 family protein
MDVDDFGGPAAPFQPEPEAAELQVAIRGARDVAAPVDLEIDMQEDDLQVAIRGLDDVAAPFEPGPDMAEGALQVAMRARGDLATQRGDDAVGGLQNEALQEFDLRTLGTAINMQLERMAQEMERRTDRRVAEAAPQVVDYIDQRMNERDANARLMIENIANLLANHLGTAIEEANRNFGGLQAAQGVFQQGAAVFQDAQVQIRDALAADRNALDLAAGRLEDARAETERLRGELGTSREEVQGLRSELGASREEVQGLRSEIEASREEVQGLHQQYEASRLEVQGLHEQLEQDRAEVQRLRENLETNVADLTAAGRRMNGVDERLAEMGTMLEESREQLEETRGEIPQLRGAINTAQDDLGRRIDEGRTQNREEVETLQANLDRTRTEFATAQRTNARDFEAMGTRIQQGLDDQAAGLDRRFETIQAEVRGGNEELSRLLTRLSENDQELERLRETVEENRVAAQRDAGPTDLEREGISANIADVQNELREARDAGRTALQLYENLRRETSEQLMQMQRRLEEAERAAEENEGGKDKGKGKGKGKEREVEPEPPAVVAPPAPVLPLPRRPRAFNARGESSGAQIAREEWEAARQRPPVVPEVPPPNGRPRVRTPEEEAARARRLAAIEAALAEGPAPPEPAVPNRAQPPVVPKERPRTREEALARQAQLTTEEREAARARRRAAIEEALVESPAPLQPPPPEPAGPNRERAAPPRQQARVVQPTIELVVPQGAGRRASQLGAIAPDHRQDAYRAPAAADLGGLARHVPLPTYEAMRPGTEVPLPTRTPTEVRLALPFNQKERARSIVDENGEPLIRFVKDEKIWVARKGVDLNRLREWVPLSYCTGDTDFVLNRELPVRSTEPIRLAVRPEHGGEARRLGARLNPAGYWEAPAGTNLREIGSLVPLSYHIQGRNLRNTTLDVPVRLAVSAREREAALSAGAVRGEGEGPTAMYAPAGTPLGPLAQWVSASAYLNARVDSYTQAREREDRDAAPPPPHLDPRPRGARGGRDAR